jgi:hypothetical protein
MLITLMAVPAIVCGLVKRSKGGVAICDRKEGTIQVG